MVVLCRRQNWRDGDKFAEVELGLALWRFSRGRGFTLGQPNPNQFFFTWWGVRRPSLPSRGPLRAANTNTENLRPTPRRLVFLKRTPDFFDPLVPPNKRNPLNARIVRSSVTAANMSDNGEIEVEAAAYQVLPKDVVSEIGSVKLFNKWSYEDVEIRDISLT